MLRLVPFMLLFFNFYVHAQSEAALEHAKKYNYNPAFRENHFDKMILKVDLEKEYEGFQTKIDDGSETQQNNDFTTNNRAKFRVSFDYDLADVDELKEELDIEEWFNLDENRVWTGLDCAKYLLNYCKENNIKFPDYIIHSVNPDGVEEIKKLLIK